MSKYYGKNIVGSLSDAQALPNATNEPSDEMVYVGNKTNGALWINVYANIDITIGASDDLSIELEAFSADTAGSATVFFSSDNAQGEIANGDGTDEAGAHFYLLHRVGGTDGELSFIAGDLMCQCAIPEDMLNAVGYDWVQLRYTVDKDESAHDIDAFVWVKA